MSANVVTWEDGTPSIGRAVAALGVFDGVHIGHQALIREAAHLASERDVASCVITFDRDPDQIITPDVAAPQLLTLDDKLAAIQGLGVDTIVVIPFCRRIADIAPDRFISDVLVDVLDPVAIVVGHDFRFGRSASGTVETLEHYGGVHGFDVVARDLVVADGEVVTSTRIRRLVASGDVCKANELLGRPHLVRGTVVHGRAAGRGLGTPTANVTPVAHAALPADGVYAGRVRLDGSIYLAGISVGNPPTFPEARDYLEAHLVDFSGDLYGDEVGLEFHSRIREQHAFATAEELSAAIHSDIAEVVRRMRV